MHLLPLGERVGRARWRNVCHAILGLECGTSRGAALNEVLAPLLALRRDRHAALVHRRLDAAQGVLRGSVDVGREQHDESPPVAVQLLAPSHTSPCHCRVDSACCLPSYSIANLACG